ncbi:ribbon-helix-helix protein, CopG family [Streptomyces sp. NPDC001530]|uniref:ribbon-helix-helix protein, CopG family n=1 Tax=Streptomyces sp. NPDC001530 TaxID=3364582 RepID=UPI0036BE5F39
MPTKNETKAMTVRLPIAQAEALATVASVENKPVSEIIRAAIAEYVDTRRRDPGFQRELKASVERAQRLLAAAD